MKAPGDYRKGIWRGGVIQCKITNLCDLSCVACTAAVGLAKKHKRIWQMSADQFRVAIRSLKGFGGVVGIFGGNPCLARDFDLICEIFREEFPNKDQRGLWSNRLFGHGKVCRETFSPIHSNLNVHRSQEAYDEIRRDWPEARILRDGLNKPSMHGSWWNAMRDLVPDEDERWRLIGSCWINQTWSAEVSLIRNELRVFFCEWASTMAEYADLEGKPDLGLPVTDGWWRQPMAYFDAQVRHYCHDCGAPLNPRKVEDLSDEPEDYTASHAPVFLTIKGKPSRLVTSREQVETDAPATRYLPSGVMRSAV